MGNNFKIILSLISILALTGCSPSSTNNSGSSSSTDSSYDDHEKTPDDTGKDDSGINNNNGNNDGFSSNVNTEGTVLGRALNLAKNVEKLPNMSSVYCFTQKQVKKEKNNKVSPSIPDEYTTETDISSPDNNYYHGALNAYYADLWRTIDQTINEAKETKNYVISKVIQFDTWIDVNEYTEFEANTFYRLNYDRNNDIATIDVYYTDGYYTTISTYYDDNGNTVINMYSYSIGTYSSYILKIDYVENQYWDATFQRHQILYNGRGEESDDGYFIYADLSKENREVTEINYTTRNGSTGFNKIVHEVHDGLTLIQTNCTVIDENVLSYKLYDENGFNLIQEYPISLDDGSAAYYVRLPLYQLDGWESFKSYTEPGTTDIWNQSYWKLVTNNGQTLIGKAGYFGMEEWEEYTTDHCQYSIGSMTAGTTSEPAIWIRTKKENIDSSINEVLNALGLSYKTDKSESMKYLLDNKEQIIADRQAFGIHGFDCVTSATLEKLVNDRQMEYMSEEQFEEYQNATKVKTKDQIMSSDRYDMLQPTVSGQAVLNNEELKIDLSNISFSLKKSALLTKGAAYKISIGYYNYGHFINLSNSNEVTFDGTNDLTFTLNDNEIYLDSFINQTEDYDYTICGQLYSIYGNNELRVSDNIAFSIGDSAYTETSSSKYVESNYSQYVKVIEDITSTFDVGMKDDLLHITRTSISNVQVEEMATPTIQVNTTLNTENEGSVLTDVSSISVSNDERFERGYDYILKIYLQDEEGINTIETYLIINYNEETNTYYTTTDLLFEMYISYYLNLDLSNKTFIADLYKDNEICQTKVCDNVNLTILIDGTSAFTYEDETYTVSFENNKLSITKVVNE